MAGKSVLSICQFVQANIIRFGCYFITLGEEWVVSGK